MSTVLLALALAVGTPAGPIAPDEIALDRIAAEPGTVARVAVHVRDLEGTLLDEGDGPDREIQSFAFQVSFPAAFVDSVAFVQAGVTAGRTAFFSQVTPAADNIYVLKAFDEDTDALLFTLDAGPPGDVIGELEIGIDPAAPVGTRIALSLQAFNAALIDDSATESETTANGNLALRDGFVVVGSELIFGDGFE